MEEDRKNEETISITREEYERLVRADVTLQHMEANGLKEWNRYDQVKQDDVDADVAAHMQRVLG